MLLRIRVLGSTRLSSLQERDNHQLFPLLPSVVAQLFIRNLSQSKLNWSGKRAIYWQIIKSRMVRMGRVGWGGMKTISGIITSPGLRASPTQCNGGKSSHYCDVLNELNENCSCWAKSRTKHTLLSSQQSHH